MKKRMKKLTAAIMALAMLFSLAVAASATSVTTWDTEGQGANAPQTSTSNPVENQGALPSEVVNVVMPTAANGAFTMVFDAHDLIAETDAARYASANNNTGAVFEEDSKFFFKNSTQYLAVPKTEELLHDIGTEGEAGYVPAGEMLTVYGEKTVTSIYAHLDSDGKVDGWKKSDGSDAAINTGIDGANTDIAAIVGKDLTKGATKDAIAAIQEKYPTIHFTSIAAGTDNVDGLAGYSYQTVDISNNKAHYLASNDNVYTGPGSASSAPTAATLATKTALEASTNPAYAVYEEYKTDVVSYKKTSDTVKIVNKGNKTISVTMKAELSGINGDTYTYAASVNNAGKFLKADGTTEITDGPALYLALTNGTATSAMEYDETNSKATAKISTTLAGSPGFFTTKWTSNNKYEDVVDDTKATADFQNMEFYLTGAINGDDGWDNLTGGSIDVTWSVKEYKVLNAPTLSGSYPVSGKPWNVTIGANKDLLFIDSLTLYSEANCGGTATPFTLFAKNQDAATGAVSLTITAKNLPATQPASIKVTFVDQKDPDLTISSTMNVS